MPKKIILHLGWSERGKMKMNVKKITELYLIGYCIIMLVYSTVNVPNPIGEWDDYCLPAVSLINEHNFSISDSDIEKAKVYFPEWADYIEGYSLSGYKAKDGGELSWYFPTYSIACVPFIVLLNLLELPSIYAFSFTNLTMIMLLLLIIYKFLLVNDKRKLMLIVFLSINPIVFYFGWISAETLIFSLIGVAMVCWHNKWYKRAALFISLASTLNPTILIIGMVMIIEYFAELLKNKGAEQGLIRYLRDHMKQIWLYGCSYIIGIIPFIYNYYNTGHINLTASYSQFLQGKESVFSRFIAYLFDWNFGVLPYYNFIFIIAILLIPVAFYRKYWSYLAMLVAFFLNVLSYSIMVHINCGMSGISRYNAWCCVVMIFAVTLYFENIIKKDIFIRIAKIGFGVSVCISGITLSIYNPFLASNTSYTKMTPIAKVVLDKFPMIYSPLYSTFNSRINNVDGGYNYILPIIYSDDEGRVRKILAKEENVEELLGTYAGDTLETTNWFQDQISRLDTKEQYLSISPKYCIKKCSKYELGKKIMFYGEEYNADKYSSVGLSSKENGFTWSDGKELVLNIQIDEECEQLHGHIELGGVFNGYQSVSILVNDKEVFSDVVMNGNNIDFEFESPGIQQSIKIKIILPDSISPATLGQSEDKRNLALAIREIIFTKIK